MPGIADLQPAQVQANSLGAVTNNIVDASSLGVLPEFKDFMDAYRQGVITAEDIRKREIVGTSGYEAERAQNVAAKSGAEQANIDINEIRPIQRELAKATAQGGVEQQTLLNQMNSQDPNIALPAQEAFHKRQDQLAAIKVFGTATPKLEVNAEVKPEPFDEWVNRQANAFQGTPDARAVYETQLRLAGEKGDEYQAAVAAAKSRTRTLDPGTPEYDLELSRRVDKSLTLAQHRAIQLEALREFSKAQGKAAGEGPGASAESHVVKEFNPVTGKEESKVVRTSKTTGDVLSSTVVGESTPTVTEAQGKAASFSKAMQDSEQLLGNLSPEFDPSAFSTTAQGFVPNRLQSEQVQLYNTAKRNWITALLRQQSGASIAKHEFTRYEQQFFPQDGDTKQVIEQKKRLRDGQTELMRLQAGPAGASAVAASATVSAPAAQQAPRPTVEESNAAPTVASPSEAMRLPPNVRFFKNPAGAILVNPNYKP